MKKIINISMLVICTFIAVSCENDLDNYDAPNGGIYGTIYDKETNLPVPLPVQGSAGTLVSLIELHTDATASVDFRAKQDGTYTNAKVFNGEYRVVVTGPFVGVCEKNIVINGQTQLDLYAIPLSRISVTASISEDNKITVDYRVKKADDSFALTDVSIIWNYAPGVDANSANYATIFPAGTDEAGTYVLDLMNDIAFIENHYKILANRNRIYVRVAATITAEEKLIVNYSAIIELTVSNITVN